MCIREILAGWPNWVRLGRTRTARRDPGVLSGMPKAPRNPAVPQAPKFAGIADFLAYFDQCGDGRHPLFVSFATFAKLRMILLRMHSWQRR